MQYIFGVVGFVCFLGMFLFFAETSHPGTRGIDKWRREHGDNVGRLKIVWLNPIDTLRLLKSPNLLAIVRLTKIFRWLSKVANSTTTPVVGWIRSLAYRLQ